QRLLHFLELRTIEEGHFTKDFFDNMHRGGKEVKGSDLKSAEAFQTQYKYVIPTLRVHYEASFPPVATRDVSSHEESTVDTIH
ncbi:hypothetical protein KIPB_011593, partial [Kipferlia bialata]